MRRIGIVTGSQIEARCVGVDPRFLVTCSGADPERARSGTGHLIEQRVEGLISFGLAGALDPSLSAGQLLLPERVLGPAPAESSPTPCGRRSGRSAPTPSLPFFEASAGWRHTVHARLCAAGLTARGGAVLGSERMIGSPMRKSDLYHQTGALAVDMESHVVAALAAAAGLPWLVLRCIADPADLALPDFLTETLGPDGSFRPAKLVKGLVRRPGAVSALVGLHRHSRTALRTLTRAGAVLGLRAQASGDRAGLGAPPSMIRDG